MNPCMAWPCQHCMRVYLHACALDMRTKQVSSLGIRGGIPRPPSESGLPGPAKLEQSLALLRTLLCSSTLTMHMPLLAKKLPHLRGKPARPQIFWAPCIPGLILNPRSPKSPTHQRLGGQNHGRTTPYQALSACRTPSCSSNHWLQAASLAAESG